MTLKTDRSTDRRPSGIDKGAHPSMAGHNIFGYK